MFVSVVVPCYRSSPALRSLVLRLTEVLASAVDRHEIILVVDGCPEGTWSVARELGMLVPAVRALRLARNFGQTNALLAGVHHARGDVVVTMDDDLQHLPEEVPSLLGAIGQGADLVYGTPLLEEHGPVRNLASRAAKAGIATVLGAWNVRHVSSFRAFRIDLRVGLSQLTGPDVSLDAALLWSTSSVRTVRVRMDKRAQGRSTYTLRRLVRYAVTMAVGSSTVPLRFVTYLGVLSGIASVALLAGVVRQYVKYGTVPHMVLLAAVVTLLFTVNLLALGVIGEYLGGMHFRSLGRPAYVIQDRLGEPVPAPRDPARA